MFIKEITKLMLCLTHPFVRLYYLLLPFVCTGGGKPPSRMTSYHYDTNGGGQPKNMSLELKLARLEQELQNKDQEIFALQDAIKDMPEFAKVKPDICINRRKSQAVLVQSYKPATVTTTRRQIEDYCR